MRKIFVFMNVSLDGRIATPDNDVSVFHSDFEAFPGGGDNPVDTLLFGHTTYEMMKFWSTPQGEAMQPEIARFMNERHKYVASHNAFEPGWHNVTVLTGDVAGQVRQMKSGPGGTIAIFGSNTLCVTLIEAGLIDEFHVVVNPVVLGDGPSLFAGLPNKAAMTLSDTRQFKSGAVQLTYTPVS